MSAVRPFFSSRCTGETRSSLRHVSVDKKKTSHRQICLSSENRRIVPALLFRITLRTFPIPFSVSFRQPPCDDDDGSIRILNLFVYSLSRSVGHVNNAICRCSLAGIEFVGFRSSFSPSRRLWRIEDRTNIVRPRICTIVDDPDDGRLRVLTKR